MWMRIRYGIGVVAGWALLTGAAKPPAFFPDTTVDGPASAIGMPAPIAARKSGSAFPAIPSFHTDLPATKLDPIALGPEPAFDTTRPDPIPLRLRPDDILPDSTAFTSDTEAWRKRIDAVRDAPSSGDSLRLMRICRITYQCGYYLRCIRSSEMDEFLDIALPLAERLATDDAKIIVYGTALFLAGNPGRLDTIARQCLHYTGQGRNPRARFYGWMQLGRTNLDNGNGLNYLFRALQELQETDDAADFSAVHRYISEYYLEQLDYENALRYARLSLQYARQCDDDRTAALAWRQTAYVCCETPDTAQRPRAREAFRQALRLYREKILPTPADPDTRYADRLYYMVTLVNVGVFASEQAESDRAEQCLTEALELAVRMRMAETIAFCYKQLGLICCGRSHYRKALACYRLAGEALRDNPYRTTESDHLVYELSFALADLHAQTGNYRLAARHYREGIAQYRAVFDADMLLANQATAAYYRNLQAEEELHRMETILRLRQRQGRAAIAVVLLLAALLPVTLLLVRYRIRAAEQQELRLRDEARKAELEKTKAELTVRLREREADDLRCKLEQGERLIGLRDAVLDDLRQYFAVHEAWAPYRARIETALLRQSRLEENLNDFRTGVKQVPQHFHRRLQERASGRLTALELRYCRMIYQGMSTREMAEALYVEPRSVRVTRYRLRRKFALEPGESLERFLRLGDGGENTSA